MVPTWLLATDVDDTLLGDDGALDRFAAATAGSTVAVVLNSSRPIASVSTGLDDPPADRASREMQGHGSRFHGVTIHGMIGALGTEIELDGRLLADWSTQFADFDRSAIDTALGAFGAPHAAEYQTAAKASYAIPSERWAEATAEANRVGFPVRVITSGTSNVDVIPAAAGKATAVRYVAALLGVPPERVVTAGDSENDADMLTTGGGIMVGNATAGLRRLVGSQAYPARMLHADGILEGLRHYGAPIATPSHET